MILFHLTNYAIIQEHSNMTRQLSKQKGFPDTQVTQVKKP